MVQLPVERALRLTLDLSQLTRKQKLELLPLLEEQARRKSLRKYFDMFPETGPCRRELYPKHLEHFAKALTKPIRMFSGGNGVGKTEGVGCYEAAAHATGLYLDWWPGIRFNKPTDGLIVGKSNETVRDIIQLKLLGRRGHYGTGILPGEQILEVKQRPNSNGAVDYVIVRHRSGGESQINFKSYEMGSDAFMGTEKDWIWGDEEMPAAIYAECAARFRTRDPFTMFLTFTPLDGVSEIITLFFPQFAQDMTEEQYEASGRALTLCSQDEVPHLTAEEKARLQANALPHEREARRLGVPSIGSGKIYPVAEESFVIKPIDIPRHWPRLYGLDVGLRVTAAVWGAWDRDSDCLYLYSEHYVKEQLPVVHAAAIKARGVWIPGEIDPSARNRNAVDASSLFKKYRDHGLRLHEADNAVDLGILNLLERMETGRLKVFSTLQNWLFEFRLYSRDKRGLVVKKNDHLMDATRYLNQGLAKHAVVNRPEKPMTTMQEQTFGLYG